MELNLSRIDHPSKLVRFCGITPDSSYLERCWGPLVGPSVVALVRRTHELTGLAGGDARIGCRDMAQLLGLKASTEPTRNNPIGKTLRRADTFRLARADLEAGTLALVDRVPLLTEYQCRRLPAWSQEQHLACVDEVMDRLRAAGVDSSVLVGRTQLRAGPLPEQPELDRARAESQQPGAPRLSPPATTVLSRPASVSSLTARLDRLATPATNELRPPSASL